MVTIAYALSQGTEILKENDVDTPRLDSEIILAHVLGLSRLKVLTESILEISENQYNAFIEQIKKRASGMPAAYILGYKEFMGLNFSVEPGILIPRPDTEIVAEKVIEECSKINGPASVVDIGCGSGAIGISVAKYAENAIVTLIDISDAAVKASTENALLNRVEDRVRILKGDLLAPVFGEMFDIVLSNPPYIKTEEIEHLKTDVRDWEPHIALDGGIDGLKYYREITVQAASCIKYGGMLIYEIGWDQAEDVCSIMNENGFKDMKIYKDLAGLDRCITAKK